MTSVALDDPRVITDRRRKSLTDLATRYCVPYETAEETYLGIVGDSRSPAAIIFGILLTGTSLRKRYPVEP